MNQAKKNQEIKETLNRYYTLEELSSNHIIVMCARRYRNCQLGLLFADVNIASFIMNLLKMIFPLGLPTGDDS